MLCEKCRKKKATFYYNEIISGQRRSFHLCGDCTSAMEAAGELEELSTLFPPFESPLSLWEDGFLGPAVTTAARRLPGEIPEHPCPACGILFKDIIATGKVGCAVCYETFSNQFVPLLRSLHGNNTHTGHIPRIHRKRVELEAQIRKLKEQLKEAIQTEAYEQAVVLRDELHRLEADLC